MRQYFQALQTTRKLKVCRGRNLHSNLTIKLVWFNHKLGLRSSIFWPPAKASNIKKVKYSSVGIKDSFYFVQYVVREELDGGRICINVNFAGGEGVLIESETLVLLLNLFANKDANKNAAQMIVTTD